MGIQAKNKLNSEAALKRALEYAVQGRARIVGRLVPAKKDVVLSLFDAMGTLLWEDSLRTLGIKKRKPLKGIVKKLKKAVR